MTLYYVQIENLHQYRNELMGRLMMMVRSRETAADLMQETYLRLVRRFSPCSPLDSTVNGLPA